MKTYKYYVHGKPKTFDLTSLTPEEIEKFKNMNNTERLRFIELHHLENIPLWEQIDLKTSTKLSDEGETDRKNKQKYSELFRAKNIKNQLEKMKEKGTEPTEENIKKVFNDFETQDITQAKKNGYADIDSLINFYANKIETLNVDSIDTLKAKEIQKLEAKNISKISVGLNGLKSVAETYKAIQDELNKHKEPVDKKAIADAILADKDFIKDLTSKTEKALNVNVSKDDLTQILNDSGLINEIIKEVKDKIDTVEALTIKLKDEESKGLIKQALKEYTSKQLTEEQVKRIITDNVKSLDEEKINQFLSDTGAIKAVMDELKNTAADLELRQKDINDAMDKLKLSVSDANEMMDLIKEYQEGLITKDELKGLMEELTKGKLTPEQINAIMNNDKRLTNLINFLNGKLTSIDTSLTDFKNILSNIKQIGVESDSLRIALKQYYPIVKNLIDNFEVFDNVDYTFKPFTKTKEPTPQSIINENGMADDKPGLVNTFQILHQLTENNLLELLHYINYHNIYTGYNNKADYAKNNEKVIKYLRNIYQTLLANFNNDIKEFEKQMEAKEKQQGQGLEYDESSEDLEEDEGGKFLNRFKDFEPDIKRLENQIELLKGNIKDIYSELKELKQTKTAENQRFSDQRDEPRNEESKSFKPSFLNDISKPKNLKPTETKIYEPEEEHKDLKDILRRRREDIEPDEIEEEEDVDWGEGAHSSQPVPGIKDKVIKFKALMKMLN